MPVINRELWQAADDVVDLFKANWTGTPLSLVLIQDQDNSTVDNQKNPWVRITVAEIGGGQETLGPEGQRRFRLEEGGEGESESEDESESEQEGEESEGEQEQESDREGKEL